MRDGGTDREEKGGWRRPMNDVRMTDCRRPGEVQTRLKAEAKMWKK